MNNPAKEYVFRKFDELKTAIRWDTYNLSRGSQDAIELKMQEFKQTLEDEYGKHEKEMEPTS